MTPWLLKLEPSAAQAPIGGKARSLLRLAAAGLPVPPALVVTAELFEAWRAAGPPLPAGLDGPGALAAVAAARAALERAPFPAGFEASLAAGLAGLAALAPGAADGGRFAVRSSADLEDRAGRLAAGIFLSRVDVAAGDVPAAVRQVMASALAPGALAYAARAGSRAPGMAVLIHPFAAGDAAGTAALDPRAPSQAAPIIEVGDGDPAALRAGARAAIEDAARRLAAGHGPVELEWVATGDAVSFLQLRPYEAPAPRRWSGDAELAALPGGPWRWDAAHNPLPLSPAQAGLVAFADARCRTAFRQRVVRGYLFAAPAGAAAPPPDPAASAPAQALRSLARAMAPRLGRPGATLEEALETFASAYEPLYGVIQPAAAAARQALAAFLRADGAGGVAPLGALLAGVPSLATERTTRAAAVAAAPDGQAREQAVAAYVALFGDEASVWDVAAPTYAEDPSLLVAAARGAAVPQHGGDDDHDSSDDDGNDDAGNDAPDLAATVRAALPPGARAAWDARLAAAREAAAVVEDDDALYARVQTVVRRALLREGERLRARGVLARADDVFWLPLESVRADARGERGASPLDAAGAARAVAEARRAHAESSADPPPVDGDAAARAETGLVRGLPASGGRAVGRAHIHPSPHGAAPAAGAVIVARTLLPTELPLLSAAAIVVETGGALGHVAAQARERGIPAIVGAAGACAAFTDGDRVLVDGDAGLAIKLPAR